MILKNYFQIANVNSFVSLEYLNDYYLNFLCVLSWLTRCGSLLCLCADLRNCNSSSRLKSCGISLIHVGTSAYVVIVQTLYGQPYCWDSFVQLPSPMVEDIRRISKQDSGPLALTVLPGTLHNILWGLGGIIELQIQGLTLCHHLPSEFWLLVDLCSGLHIGLRTTLNCRYIWNKIRHCIS